MRTLKFILIFILFSQNALVQAVESKSDVEKSKNWTGYYRLNDDGERIRGVAGAYKYCSKKGSGVAHFILNKKEKSFVIDEFLGDVKFQERLEVDLNYKSSFFPEPAKTSLFTLPSVQIDRDFIQLPKVIFQYNGPTYLYQNSVSQIGFERLRDQIKVERKEQSDFIYVIRRDTRDRSYYREGVFTRCRYERITEEEFKAYLNAFNAQQDSGGFIQTRD